MSRTHNPISEAYAAKVAASLPEPEPTSSVDLDALSAEVTIIKARLQTLENLPLTPQQQFEAKIRKMNEELEAHLARHATWLKEKLEAENRAYQKRQREPLGPLYGPRFPSLAALQELAEAAGQFLNQDSYGGSSLWEQECQVWPYWCRLVDALHEATHSPVSGWNAHMQRCLKAFQEGVEVVAKAWGLGWSLSPDRDEVAAAKRSEWLRVQTLNDRKDALMWMVAYDAGQAPPLDAVTEQLALEALASGMKPPPVPDLVKKLPIPAGTKAPSLLAREGLIPNLVRHNVKVKHKIPCLGSTMFKLNLELRPQIEEPLFKLRANLPAPSPQKGYILNGAVVPPIPNIFGVPGGDQTGTMDALIQSNPIAPTSPDRLGASRPILEGVVNAQQ